MTDANPLLEPSSLPYGLPDYRRIAAADYLPAFRAAFAAHRDEVARIAANPSEATFQNTLVALEESGHLLGDVARTFYTVSSADATDDIQVVEEELAPLMAAHQDAIQLDPTLYARVRHVYDALEHSDLSPEDRYLVERRYREMTHAGAAL